MSADPIRLNVQSNYYTDPQNMNVLHFKPISHRLASFNLTLGSLIFQSADSETWQGKLKIHLAKGIVGTGYVLNSLIAIVESAAAFAFAALALSIHALTSGRSITFQKITLKLCAYWIDTVLVAISQIACLSRGVYSKYHSLNAAANHTIHATAALISQIIGYGFDRWAERDSSHSDQPSPSCRRGIQVLNEIIPTALLDISSGAVRDFAFHITDQPSYPDLQTFINNNAEHRDVLEQFTIDKLFNNQDYRQRFLQLIGNYLVQTRIIYSAIVHINAQNANEVASGIQVFGVSNNEEDRKYQDKLKALIKKSFIELHDNHELICLLSEKNTTSTEQEEEGRTQLTTLLATREFAHYVQLKELEEEINCPEVFGAYYLQPYNTRFQSLQDAKASLGQLNDDEKLTLIKLLLQTSDFDINDQGLETNRIESIQKLFNDIGKLAGDLHQGKLLTFEFINPNEASVGRFFESFGASNFFLEACKEAVNEIEKRKE